MTLLDIQLEVCRNSIMYGYSAEQNGFLTSTDTKRTLEMPTPTFDLSVTSYLSPPMFLGYGQRDDRVGLQI